ncbi:hypothetical protein N1F89_01450 [Aquibium sp. A9E412]|uniref:WD40/YVTN/BNR-like repeat-containing protein n=1 Tax=Aquibium sp. A9E412 TaxID=2976767 RepID=UPI0025AF9BD1|nr:hypothetical protein [Aquibium sp. A9E412]MDN2564874.1 hypothetical protein [Aquibium sp. A9E412]
MTTLYAATGDGFARLEAAAASHTTTVTLEGRGVRCLTVDPRDGDTVYAGTPDGVLRSADGGRNWRALPLAGADVFSLAVSAADGAVYAGTEPSRLHVSRDAGATWRELDALRALPSAPDWSFPPRPWTSHVSAIAPDPHDADRLIAGIELGGLMLSRDGGARWIDHRPGAQKDVHALAWHPRAAGRAYEAGGGGAAWSRDGGESWRPADAGRPDAYCWGLEVDAEDADTWYVSTAPGPRHAHDPDRDAEAAIHRWRGDGPWVALATGLTSLPRALAAAPGRLFAGLGDGRLLALDPAGGGCRRLAPEGPPPARIEALAVAG